MSKIIFKQIANFFVCFVFSAFLLLDLLLLDKGMALAESPTDVVKIAVEKVVDTVKAKKDKIPEEELDASLSKIIKPIFNFEEMSKRSLGADWSKATPAEQKEFIDLFSDLLGNTYLKRIKRNAQTSSIKRIAEEITDNKAMVRSIMSTSEEDISIDYRMINGQQGWRVYDVVVENIGLVSNYRNEFPPVIRKDGFPGLIKKLHEKQAEIAKEDKEAAAKK